MDIIILKNKRYYFLIALLFIMSELIRIYIQCLANNYAHPRYNLVYIDKIYQKDY